MISCIHTVYASSSHNYYTLTLSILSYSSWNDTAVPNLCIFDANENTAAIFSKYVRQYNMKYRVFYMTNNDTTKCNILYFSSISSFIQQKNYWTNHLPINTLIFVANDGSCENGSSFCLYKKNEKVTFNINLDAVGRSHVHVDPRILLLAKISE